MPRKLADAGELASAALASMRPGLLCPGRGRVAGSRTRKLAGFNEAGAVMPRKSASRSRPAWRQDALQ